MFCKRKKNSERSTEKKQRPLLCHEEILAEAREASDPVLGEAPPKSDASKWRTVFLRKIENVFFSSGLFYSMIALTLFFFQGS